MGCAPCAFNNIELLQIKKKNSKSLFEEKNVHLVKKLKTVLRVQKA
jgi:hypothetical protein